MDRHDLEDNQRTPPPSVLSSSPFTAATFWKLRRPRTISRGPFSSSTRPARTRTRGNGRYYVNPINNTRGPFHAYTRPPARQLRQPADNLTIQLLQVKQGTNNKQQQQRTHRRDTSRQLRQHDHEQRNQSARQHIPSDSFPGDIVVIIMLVVHGHIISNCPVNSLDCQSNIRYNYITLTKGDTP